MSATLPREILEEFLTRLADPQRRGTVPELFVDEPTLRRPGELFSGPTAVEDYLSAGDGRFEWVDKKFEWWVESANRAVSSGTLYGVTAAGVEFECIRYVDMCEVEDGRIARLEVINDLYVEGIL